ncbi:MAG: hypothetical protein GVY27_03345 [Deinococcus-Thermus bacterium]|jgi:signal recognition particle receptor subunit beta|nr:hypothetical protein [Deinococcota bacterium]
MPRREPDHEDEHPPEPSFEAHETGAGGTDGAPDGTVGAVAGDSPSLATAGDAAAGGDALPQGQGDLFAACLDGLAPYAAEREEVLDLLDQVAARGGAEAARAAGRERDRLLGFEASVTMIGQVKSGKTTLVNAMIGAPGLLPADVNPWTSVVTSLHLGPRAAQAPRAARFTFFDPEDWDRLTRKGGRVGELAARSGAEEEAEKVRRQVEAMREKTRRRLGRRFEMLLGTCHDYGDFDAGLIERYVCLGDDFLDGEDAEADAGQGRFADVTKAADLWLPREDWPLDLCLRDTPGVNDTFMMREQITIRAIRESRLCVVVLSAHQAMSSVDMALIRLIANVRSREVVIFVNRVDELSDPGRQIEEIRDSLRATLSGHRGLEEVEILFGSAHWATLALTGELSTLEDEAADALLAYAEEALPGLDRELGPLELVWWLSGVPALYRTLWSRILAGAGRERLQSAARAAMNLATGLSAAAAADPARLGAAASDRIDEAALLAELDTLEAGLQARFDSAFATALDAAGQRLDRSHRSFLDRATAALVKHLELHGEGAPWRYDPTGLRLLLRSGYHVFARQVRAAGEEVGAAAADGVAALYAAALDRPAGEIRIQPPTVPRLPPPVLLGQTIALDLEGTWWRRWWSRRRGYAAFAPDFYEMIQAETRPILDDLRETHCAPAGEAVRTELARFFDDQRMLIRGLARGRGDGSGDAAPDAAALDDLSHAASRLGRLAA